MSQQPTLTALTSEAREVAPDIWWIPACFQLDTAGTSVHVHNAPYLILGPEKTLLFDTAPPSNWEGVSLELDRLLEGRKLDYVVPSHPENPHCGNLHRLFAKDPEVKLLGDVRDYHLYDPDDLDRFVELEHHSVIDLGGDRQFVLLPMIVKDLPGGQWGYATAQQVLFTSDAFAYSHRAPLGDLDEDRPIHTAGECGKVATELSDPPGPDEILWITRAALYWAQFTNILKYKEPFAELIGRYPAKMVAPAHGAVIDDMKILDLIWDALSLAYDPASATKRKATYLPTFDR